MTESEPMMTGDLFSSRSAATAPRMRAPENLAEDTQAGIDDVAGKESISESEDDPVQGLDAIGRPSDDGAEGQSHQAEAAEGEPEISLPEIPPEAPLSAIEFRQSRHRAATAAMPAEWGWRGKVNRGSLGLVKLRRGPDEVRWHEARSGCQVQFAGPRTVMVANPKGGADKTPSVIQLAATLGVLRGGGVLAWDDNESAGSLAERAEPAPAGLNVRDLIGQVDRLLTSPHTRLGDLAPYLREQASGHFDLLPSSGSGDPSDKVTGEEFAKVHNLMTRFYRLVLLDTGNDWTESNWRAAADAADALVVPTTVRIDHVDKALKMLDNLVAHGRGDLVQRSVAVISSHDKSIDRGVVAWAKDSFAARCAEVMQVPYEPLLESGGSIIYGQLSQRTRDAWQRVGAAVCGQMVYPRKHAGFTRNDAGGVR